MDDRGIYFERQRAMASVGSKLCMRQTMPENFVVRPKETNMLMQISADATSSSC